MENDLREMRSEHFIGFTARKFKLHNITKKARTHIYHSINSKSYLYTQLNYSPLLNKIFTSKICSAPTELYQTS